MDFINNLFIDTEWTIAHKEKLAKYGGYDVISDDVAISIFESIVLPSLYDFVRLKKGLFAKQTETDIFHVLKFGRARTTYEFWWGVSLAYVPHQWDEDGCKFHRTLKSVRRDLHDHENNLRRDAPTPQNPPFGVDFFVGEACFRDELVRAWKNLEPMIRDWLSSITTHDGVLKQSQFQIDNYDRYRCHHPDPHLVKAFTLARIGQFKDGLAVLEQLMESKSQFYAFSALPKALKKIAEA